MLFDKVAADLICTLNWSHILNFMELNESCLAVALEAAAANVFLLASQKVHCEQN